MDSKKSNVSFRSTDASSKKSKPVVQDIYDLWRPPEGVRYELEQTNIEMDAIVPHVQLKYTTVEYEPGQDLTEHPVEEPPVKFVKQRGRGPVFKFLEDIRYAKHKKLQEAIIHNVLANCRRKAKQKGVLVRAMHKHIMSEIGPVWYHELSPKQMQSADNLKEAMKKDHNKDTIINTQETLTDMGIVLRPNHTKVKYALKRFYLCPAEFLLTLVRLNRPKDSEKLDQYTLNDRIMLSCVVHLTMRETLRELHLRIPSPPNVDRTKVKKPKKKSKRPRRHYPKWKKGMSPYLKPEILVEQKHIDEVYKNRHKEYASLDYFDYVNDMWDVFLVDDPESVQKRKAATEVKQTKWNRPPKIPVRFIESKMKKKKIFLPKKPSPYISPCKKIRFSKRKKEEVLPEKPPIENLCICSPQNFNEDTAFNLKIKITTSKDEILMTQKLYPYNANNNVGDLKLAEKNKLTKEGEKYASEDGKPYKKIEYSCECCTCGKAVNIIPDESTTTGPKNINNIKELIDGQLECSQNCLNTIDEESEAYELYEGEEESELSTRICKCKSISSHTTTPSDINDPYYLCTCKKSSDDCTCCICDQIDQDFILKIKRYNQIHGTRHQPCLCACKCKKKKKLPCCDTDDDGPCKYCFCKKKKPVVIEEEEEEEEEEEIKEEEKHEPEKETEVKKVPSKDKRHTVISEVEVTDTDQDKKCECEKMYTRFLDQHESCISLFGHYEQKIQEDIEEYIKDMKNRCLCGDSDTSINEEEEEETENYEDMGEESTDTGSCLCLKPNAVKCCCCADSAADLYGGCTCNETGVSVAGCTCNYTDTTSTESTDTDKCYCACNCTDGPCQCAVMLQQVMEAKAAKIAGLEGQPKQEAPKKPVQITKKSAGIPKKPGGKPNKSAGTSNKSFKKRAEMTEAQIEKEMIHELGGEEGGGETDPRIFVLDEFPQNPIEQMDLLKAALAALADDGYPLAKLPDVHRLPHFQVWLNKRSGKFISMEDRENLYEISKVLWQHVEICGRQVANPELPIPVSEVRNVTWGRVKTYKYLISKVKTAYRHRLKQAYIDQAQEMFPSCFFYLLPTKTFREVYFSYLPADENHCFVVKPWAFHEHKDMSKRKPCL